LQAQKRIPDGEDGDKRVDEVYKYMADENEKRMKLPANQLLTPLKMPWIS
jgi:hypothetical protein